MNGRPKPESAKIMEEMVAAGIGHPHYETLKRRWLAAVNLEAERQMVCKGQR